jgi:hypothetical protein
VYALGVKQTRNPLVRMRDRLGYRRGQPASAKVQRPPHSGPREEARRRRQPGFALVVADGRRQAVAAAQFRKRKHDRSGFSPSAHLAEMLRQQKERGIV